MNLRTRVRKDCHNISCVILCLYSCSLLWPLIGFCREYLVLLFAALQSLFSPRTSKVAYLLLVVALCGGKLLASNHLYCHSGRQKSSRSPKHCWIKSWGRDISRIMLVKRIRLREGIILIFKLQAFISHYCNGAPLQHSQLFLGHINLLLNVPSLYHASLKFSLWRILLFLDLLNIHHLNALHTASTKPKVKL